MFHQSDGYKEIITLPSEVPSTSELQRQSQLSAVIHDSHTSQEAVTVFPHIASVTHGSEMTH